MNEPDLLEAYVPPFDSEPEDWDDVVRRARPRLPRRRLVLVAAVLAAALAGGPALGVLLLRDRGPQLPSGADKSRVVVALYPRASGRMFVALAPWKGHDGVCILFVGRSAGCWHRTARGTMALMSASAEWGYTFDRRATGAAALLLSGRRVPLAFTRFPSLGIAVFASTKPIHGDVQAVLVLAAGGRALYPPMLEFPVPSR